MLKRAGTQIARGFAMGAADIVPGVSGGTVALLVGIYDELVGNIKLGARALGSFARLDFATGMQRVRDVDWLFLVPLVVGILAAIGALSSVIEDLLHDHPEAMAGLFSGLVVASVVVAVELVTRWDAVTTATTITVAVATFVLLGFQNGPVADPSILAFFGGGAIAICAMILPGISGSFLLLMIGMYAPVLGAVNDRALGDLLVFGLGVVIGLALFSNLLGFFLDNHRDLTLGALVGLMAGSMRVLWPWPHGVGVVSDLQDEVVDGTGLSWPASGEPVIVPILLAVVAFVVVIVVDRLASPTGDDLHAD